MAHSRIVLHPVLANKRSRFILFLFSIVAVLAGFLIWWKMTQLMIQADLAPSIYKPDKWYLTLLLSHHFKYTIILVSAVLATGLTAHYVIGPVRRIEQWILDWKTGKPVEELRVRKKDKFTTMVKMINEIREKYKE